MSDGIGEMEPDTGGANPSVPDISDIEGATTGPLRQPAALVDPEVDPTNERPAGPPPAGTPADPLATGTPGDASANTEWAAPSIDELKEAADAPPIAGEPTGIKETGIKETGDQAPTAGESTELLDVVDRRPAGGNAATPDKKPATIDQPRAAPTVSIDAKRALEDAALHDAALHDAALQDSAPTTPSLAVTTAAAMQITTGELPRVPAGEVDATIDVAAGGGTATVVASGLAAGDTKRGAPSSDAGPRPPTLGGPPKGRSGRSGPKPVKIALFALLGLLVLFLGTWLIDTALTSGEVVRNTTLGSVPIGGLDRSELEAAISDLDRELDSVPLTVAVGGTGIDTTPSALGAQVDREAVIDEALSAGRDDNILTRPISWINSFTGERSIEPTYLVDPDQASAAVSSVFGGALADPVEPTIVLQGSDLTLSPGSNGVTIDPAEIVDVLPPVLRSQEPYAISLAAVATTPRLTDESVETVVVEASDATAAPVVFRVLDQSAQVEPVVVRGWIRLDDADSADVTWSIDAEAAVEELQPRFPVLGSDEQQARFEVVDGIPEIFPATETVVCCDTTSVEGIRDALLAPAPPSDDDSDDGEGDSEASDEEAIRTIALEPEVVSPDEGVAELESLGIVEEVSTFTTNFPCCAPRVTNIQRFADLMRGVIIRPGEDFSLNDHVGRRTIENGFVADGAIANGILEPQVGGGISQFATTFFNASFFAGLDFNEYQSHSLYISRYPRGREATISFPRPDLSVNNSTDYGVLVWTSYTDTSITVTFYSTEHIDVVAGDLRRSDQSACSRYTTPRTRTYPNGDVAEDSVFAVYRPGEGLDCNGNSTRPEEEPTGPTEPTAPPATTEPEPEPATTTTTTTTTTPPDEGDD